MILGGERQKFEMPMTTPLVDELMSTREVVVMCFNDGMSHLCQKGE
jgi:hypothetical protein